MKNINNYIFTFPLFMLLFCCTEPIDPITENDGLLFSNTYEILIEEYEYIDSATNKLYKINNDSIVDTLSSMPEFRWSNITNNLVTVAISKEQFIVSDNQIVNAEQIIWQWHNGLDGEYVDSDQNKYLTVPFLKGRNVINKNILYTTQPLPLENGLYVWAVWGWDESGTKVIFSSKPKCFVVK